MNQMSALYPPNWCRTWVNNWNKREMFSGWLNGLLLDWFSWERRSGGGRIRESQMFYALKKVVWKFHAWMKFSCMNIEIVLCTISCIEFLSMKVFVPKSSSSCMEILFSCMKFSFSIIFMNEIFRKGLKHTYLHIEHSN